jgi:ABC-type phosphate transport system permease subunit
MKNQIRAHNSFLTSAITFGVFGFMIFVYLLTSSGRIQIQRQNLSGFIFWTIMLVTFLFEDTLETQTGITMFAFFIALFSLPIPRPSMD